MSKGAGLFLILAGVGAAAYTVPAGLLPGTGSSAEQRLADVVQIATKATAVTRPKSDGDGQPARFAAPALANASPAGAARTAPVIVAQVQVQKSDLPGNTERAGTPAANGRVSIVPSAKTTEIVPPVPTAVVRRAAPRAGDQQARATLARDIQRELKRVGCLDGEVSAEWNPAARNAMKAFIERVNATLPVEEPDHILLTLVQGHTAKACGKTCPTGQSLASDNRCVPTAVLAQAVKRPLIRGDNAAVVQRAPPAPTPARGWETNTRVSSAPVIAPQPRIAMAPPTPPAPVPAVRPSERPEGRMALAGPADAAARSEIETGAVVPGGRLGPQLPGALAALDGSSDASRQTPSGVASSPRQPAARAPRPSVGVYNPPPPRRALPPPSYVVRAAPQPRYEGRSRLTPSIFTQLTRDGR